MPSQALGNKGKYYKHLYYVFRFLYKVEYDNNKFNNAPTYTYNRVMQLLEMAGVVESE